MYCRWLKKTNSKKKIGWGLVTGGILSLRPKYLSCKARISCLYKQLVSQLWFICSACEWAKQDWHRTKVVWCRECHRCSNNTRAFSGFKEIAQIWCLCHKSYRFSWSSLLPHSTGAHNSLMQLALNASITQQPLSIRNLVSLPFPFPFLFTSNCTVLSSWKIFIPTAYSSVSLATPCLSF